MSVVVASVDSWTCGRQGRIDALLRAAAVISILLRRLRIKSAAGSERERLPVKPEQSSVMEDDVGISLPHSGSGGNAKSESSRIGRWRRVMPFLPPEGIVSEQVLARRIKSSGGAC